MSVAIFAKSVSPVPHIGPAPHRRRNAWLAFGVLAATVGVASHYVYWGRQNAAATERLDRFSVAYSQRCDPTALADQSSAMVKKVYLASSTLGRAIDEQLAALEAGASCEQVYKALRAVDFPIAAPPAPIEKTPTITLQPPSP